MAQQLTKSRGSCQSYLCDFHLRSYSWYVFIQQLHFKLGYFPHTLPLADFLRLFFIDKHAKLYTDFKQLHTLTDALHILKYMVGVSYLVRRSAEDPEGLQGGGILAVPLPALQLHVGNIHSQCCGFASLPCGSGSGSSFTLLCGYGSFLSLWCGSLSGSHWCGSKFGCYFHHFTFIWIRILLFTLVWIRIQLPKMIRNHADTDPDPQHCSFIHKNNNTILSSKKLLVRGKYFPGSSFIPSLCLLVG